MLAVAHLALWAGKVVTADTITVEVRYRQGSSRLDPAYCENGSRFDIISGASPEGSALLNKKLSESRTRISSLIWTDAGCRLSLR